MNQKIRWGILGPGGIANTFANELLHLPDAQIVAVGSRSQERADSFAAKHNIPHAYGSYDALIADPNVDIVYVATPHSEHKDNVLASLLAGKAVLCEKAFTVNASELEELILIARENKVFLMEAMWTRYLPAIHKVREWLASGVIGDVNMVDVRFGNRTKLNPTSRLFNPALAGGALLDVGIYCVSFISMIMGRPPSTIHSVARIGTTGVDEEFSALFGYEGRQMANLMAGLRLKTKHEAIIYGTDGEIRIPKFWEAKTAVLSVYGKQEERFEDCGKAIGYMYEAAEAMRCLQQGKIESDIMPLDESLAIMRTLDALRGDWGMKYPFETR
ncbi:Predicted dehydrogenase [Paenibacillus sp. 1_12]|uniref:Gfo/Idh/MocA family protein n=1 Tax=Paenibacillus sp. 1_12 TaxID=1566278 RepID=UPI0008EB73C6|nr:Gfo/Idh/MocA family oxidoreductase [Paenibacillus sp. 1_12]SFL80307.1 Predicted dehydrogenase [Paenibacillus sp. 1_12]